MRITSQLRGAERQRGLDLAAGVWPNTSRVIAVMIGRIMIASTTPAVKIVPVRTGLMLPGENSEEPAESRSEEPLANGSSAGARTRMPQMP